MAKPSSANSHKKTLYASQVHKFGGSSLKDKSSVQRAIKIIQNKTTAGDYIVVSANGNVTNLLLDVFENKSNLKHNNTELSKILCYLTELAQETLVHAQPIVNIFNKDVKTLSDTINFIGKDELLAYGELWSAQLLHAALQEAGVENQWYDARVIFKACADGTKINKKHAIQQLKKHARSSRSIITGFIASNAQGKTITLGRNGSDYSATLLASFLGSAHIYLWTDVDGVYSADPHVISSAQRIKHLSLCEAQALAELGSDVLHEKTIDAVINSKASIHINCSSLPSNGTSITVKASETQKIKTIACKSQLIGLKIIDIDEFSTRKLQSNLIAKQLFSYANSYDKTQRLFRFYIEKKYYFTITSYLKAHNYNLEIQNTNISLVSLVGHDIRQNHAVLGKIFNRCDAFDIQEIYYPANAHTLCIIIAEQQAQALVKDLHQTFFTLETSIPIIVLGYGNIGQQFLQALANKKNQIESTVKQSLSIIAIANSRHYVIKTDEQNCLLEQVNNNHLDLSLGADNHTNQIFDQLNPFQQKNAIVIDLTASDYIAQLYPTFAANKWHIISANKIAASQKYLADEVNKQQKISKSKWLKNTTVGAGLPIQSSIKKVLDSGDNIKSVSGVFSGSLSWLFSEFSHHDTKFSQLVKQAHDNALTEPDPREDLSGQDVFRKVRILARDLGFNQAQEIFEPAIPERFLHGELFDFWNNSTALDQHFSQLQKQANETKGLLRYIATLTPEKLVVKLQIIAPHSLYAQLNPCDNIFIIQSDWYDKNPLVIQGPGAGKEVTAAGVLNDLIDVLKN